MAQLLQDLAGELYRQALLVQQNEGESDNVFFVKDLLQKRGYKIRIIGVEEYTSERVLGSVDELAHNSIDNSRTFFYYAGHSSRIGGQYAIGIATRGHNVNIHSQRIAPCMLFKRLVNVRGKKAVVIDTCLSGEFVEELSRHQGEYLLTDYVLITSTTRKGLCITTDGIVDTKDTPLAGRKISPLVYWMYTNASIGRTINLANTPIPNVTVTEDALRDLQLKYPEMDIQRMDLQIQRVSDTDFFL